MKTKWLILSDIHANMEALNACLDKAKEIGYDRIACLGDFVGYGPNPNEVVAWAIEQKDAVFVLGNHDKAIGDEAVDISDYNYMPRLAIEIHRDLISVETRKFLMGLPETITVDNMQFIHGSPYCWDEYIHERYEAMAVVKYIIGDICFIGHTHSPVQWKDDHGVVKIVNVGSVGQPRDYDPRASFVIYEDKTKKIKNIRVKYDIPVVQEKMKKIGIPDLLVNRLTKGN